MNDSFQLTSGDDRHRAITSRWSERVKAALGFKYNFIPKDAKTLQRFLKTSEIEADAFLDLAEAAWQRAKDDCYARRCREAATIHGLCTFFNEIQLELQVPVSGAKNKGGWLK